jgi:hypothetical protein
MSDKEYKILQVEPREEWTSKKWGTTFKPYALRLEDVDGWVELSQKPETAAPEVGGTLYGHTESQTQGDKTYLKFKKVNQEYAANSGSSATSASSLQGADKTLDYIVQMLEELTGRRKKPDAEPSDEEMDKAIKDSPDFDLSEIPF